MGSILKKDTVIEQNLYLITRFCYFKRKVSYYKILSLHYLVIRYFPFEVAESCNKIQILLNYCIL